MALSYTDSVGLPAGTYQFNADGKMIINNGVVGDYLYINGVMQTAYQLVEFEGNYYFINDGNKVIKNASKYLALTYTDSVGLPAGTYQFDAEGKMIIKHGVIGDNLYINGAMQTAYQLVEFEGNYYFINDGHRVIKNASKYLTATHTSKFGLPAGTYQFDADGKLIINHGVVGNYLYINGVMQKAYQLVEFEGNYYFINDGNKVIKNASKYLTATHTSKFGIPAGTYQFDADGKLVIKNGVVGDYLYINGVMQTAYQLVEFEGNYYFINDGNKLVKNASKYLNANHTSKFGLPAGTYQFGADGKLIIKHGVIGDNLYIKGVLQTAYQLIEFEGNYYFINDGNKIVKNASKYLTATHTSKFGLPAGTYQFDADGKIIIKNGLVGDYLYINGAMQKAYQLVEFEGNYYFIGDGNVVIKNSKKYLNAAYVVGKYHSDGCMIEVGYYYFDENGKMIVE